MAARPAITADDCRSCGACCIAVHDYPLYVDVEAEDVARMSRAFRSRAVVDCRYPTDPDPILRLKTKHDAAGNCVCIALRGTVGSRVSCSIYDRRPRVCSRFQVGGPDCRHARRQAGLE